MARKLDELMVLCDELEAVQKEREAGRDRLVTATLHRLTSATPSESEGDADAFTATASFLLQHLIKLTHRREDVFQLRGAIRDVALHGRLSDSVSMTFRNTRPDDEPFALPSNWKWLRLEDITELVTDGEHATPTRIPDHDVPLVTAKNVRDGYMDLAQTDWVSRETAEKAWKRCKPAVGDLLLVCVGATIGRLTVLREAPPMVLVRSVALIRPNLVDVDFLALILRSPWGQSQIWKRAKATGQPCLYINQMKSLPIPVPPLSEQQRILDQVDGLMDICDKLDEVLVGSESLRAKLLEATLSRTLSEVS